MTFWIVVWLAQSAEALQRLFEGLPLVKTVYNVEIYVEEAMRLVLTAGIQRRKPEAD